MVKKITIKKKKIKKLKVRMVVPFETVGDKLNIKQELFCQYYTKNNNLFGNATFSYAQAYGFKLDALSKIAPTQEVWDKKQEKMVTEIIDDSEYDKAYNVCSVAGQRLLRNVKINDRTKELLCSMMTESEFDSELAYTMRQRDDLGAKMQAVKEFNKLKNRITEKIEVTEIKTDPGTEEKSNSLLKKYLHGTRTTSTK